MKRIKSFIATLAIACAISGGIASTDIPSARADEVTRVRLGLGPYFDYQPWFLAHNLGLDKEQGIDLELTTITSIGTGIASMRQGSMEGVFSGLSVDFPFYKSVPSLRSWLITDQFAGFIVVGRKGQTDTFESLKAQIGAEKAKEQILNSFKGKTFSVVLSVREQMLGSAFSQVGMTTKDVKFADFPDDAQAALAFVKGVGDYYMGGLPQETKLLQSPDKFVNVGGQEILGPAGLWYTTIDSLEPWLQAHNDTALKLVAIWYRMMRYMKEKPDVVIPMLTKAINESAAASFTPDEVKASLTMLDFRTIEEAQKTQYDPNSDIYWKKAVDFYSTLNKEHLPDNFDPRVYDTAEALFNDFLKHKDLVDWVNSPLK
jgi:ABC-type nitrate/sulfonate/bicarbonate transport system substrate-binding protein